MTCDAVNCVLIVIDTFPKRKFYAMLMKLGVNVIVCICAGVYLLKITCDMFSHRQSQHRVSLLNTELNICFHTNAHEQNRCSGSCQVVTDTREDGGRGRRKVGPL